MLANRLLGYKGTSEESPSNESLVNGAAPFERDHGAWVLHPTTDQMVSSRVPRPINDRWCCCAEYVSKLLSLPPKRRHLCRSLRCKISTLPPSPVVVLPTTLLDRVYGLGLRLWVEPVKLVGALASLYPSRFAEWS